MFAAASLKATFTEIGTIFQTENPGSTVTFNFAGSSDLVTQLTAGAPADVFASADTNNMTKATTANLVSGTPVNFASNILTIVTPPGNPAGITGFADLANPDVSVVVCAPQVPCGAAAATVETNTGVDITPVSEENSVTDVLGKITSGQADAGLVYVTDAKNAGDKVTEVRLPGSGRRGERLSDRDPDRSDPTGVGDEVRRPGHRAGRPAGLGRGRVQTRPVTTGSTYLK